MKLTVENVYAIIKALETEKYILEVAMQKENRKNVLESYQYDIKRIDEILPTLKKVWGDKYHCSACGKTGDYDMTKRRICECGNELFDVTPDKVLSGEVTIDLT